MTSRKAELRRQIQSRRHAIPNKDALSHDICDHVISSSWFQAAQAVMFYVDVRDEVRTRAALETCLHMDKLIAVPTCTQTTDGVNSLQAIKVESMDELTAGAYGILEPLPRLQTDPSRHVPPQQLDIVLVPGVAFDHLGTRLGHGAGYYDHFLSQVGPHCLKVALAYHCQLIDKLPQEPHDIPMNLIVTECGTFETV